MGAPKEKGRLSLGKAKLKSCNGCGTRFPESRAQCPSCRAWDFGAPRGKKYDDGTVLASEVSHIPIRMLSTGPWDECFGEEQQPDGSVRRGIPVVGITLISGDPGAGKSTIALQLSESIIELTGREVLYIAKEEATSQVISRMKRLKFKQMDKLRLYPIEASSDLAVIFETRKPAAIIVDSLPKLIPNTEDAVTFVENLKDYVVALESPALVINHIIKGGDMAGLEKLQHAVDTTLDFLVDNPDDENNKVRYLNVKKNRFGPDGISVPFLMTATGLIAMPQRDPPGGRGDDGANDDDEDEEEEGEDDE